MGDSVKTAPFSNADERDEARWRFNRLESAISELLELRADPALKPYLLAAVGSGMPSLPQQADVLLAAGVIEQAMACLRHHYDQRRRYDDPDIAPSASGDLDDEQPF